MNLPHPDDICITCADHATSAVVAGLGVQGLATVTADGQSEEISVALVDARVGDTVLVHAAEAIAVVPARRVKTS